MLLVLALSMFLAVHLAHGQEQLSAAPISADLIDAPSGSTDMNSPPLVQPGATQPSLTKTSAEAHAFWDRTNILLFSGVAAFRALDYASTRNFMSRGRTEVLLPDDVVENSAGFAALEAAATATSVGISYILHHSGHHKMERWLSIGHIGVTAFGVAWNYSLESKHYP